MHVRHWTLNISIILFCSLSQSSLAQNLLDKRGDFKTTVVKNVKEKDPLATPPKDHPFKLLSYKTDIGDMAAYLVSPKVDDVKKKSPAIIWITGGHPQGGASPSYIDGASYKNNQTANMFFEHGVITMYPTFRGTFGNPGIREEFFGEVNDVLSALKYLQKQPQIDAQQIYLGGHSTGATLALLAAAASDGFAGVLALGAQDNVKNHGGGGRLFDVDNSREYELRAPINHLASIKSPTFVIEGEYGVSDALRRMQASSKNSNVRFWEIKGADHFDVIQSSADLYARAIIKRAENPTNKIVFEKKTVNTSYQSLRQNMMRGSALSHLATASMNGVDINQVQTLTHYFYSEYQGSIDELSAALKKAKFSSMRSEVLETSDGSNVIRLTAQRKQKPADLAKLFSDYALFERLEKQWTFEHRHWYPE